MADLTSLRTRYSMSWKPVGTKPLSEEIPDFEDISSIEVVAGDWGSSAQINFDATGQMEFLSLSRENQNIPVGTKLKKELCFVCTLERGSATTKKLLYKSDTQE